MAKRINECVRPEDVAARMGGDEFAVLIDDIRSESNATELADRIIARLREPVALNDVSVAVQASVGIAYRPVDGTSAESVLRDADIAMYRAKQTGRSLCAFRRCHARASRRAFRLHADLRRALRDDEFIVHFQPIVETVNGTLLGFEALERWNHPSRGLVMSGEFVPIAKDKSAIVPIGTCILRKALFAMKNWRERHRPRERCASA